MALSVGSPNPSTTVVWLVVTVARGLRVSTSNGSSAESPSSTLPATSVAPLSSATLAVTEMGGVGGEDGSSTPACVKVAA